jgi:7,8-dihydropterin-6-yl-methyl-4-(beta-D-ribofuranosyl)aminobenzene 5'-phosphate synthase
VSPVELIVLNDNRGAPGLVNEWGWSVLLVKNGMKVLFDADSKPSVLEYNVEKLGLNLTGLEFSVLSHEHWDHYGGYPYVARVNPGLTVYVPPGSHDWAKGLNLNLVENRKGVRVGEDFTIIPPLRAGIGLREHALTVKVSDTKMIVIVGCSHPGIDRIVEEAVKYTGLKPLLVIGGFHGPTPHQLDRVAEHADLISPAHCSGEEAVNYVKTRYPGKLLLVRTGSILRIIGNRVELVRY